jgi:hypothetical protein
MGAALGGQAPYYKEICGIIRVVLLRAVLLKLIQRELHE